MKHLKDTNEIYQVEMVDKEEDDASVRPIETLLRFITCVTITVWFLVVVCFNVIINVGLVHKLTALISR